jgi:hypothetical protein
MTRRPRRTIPAALTALVILAACVLVAVSIVQELTGRPAVIPFGILARDVRTWRLDAPAMLGTGAVAAVAGLVLLGCAVIPGRRETLALAAIPAGPGDEPGDEGSGGGTDAFGGGTDAGVSRTGLRAALRATIADVDGVTSAKVRVRRRQIAATVRTELADSAELGAAVRDALGQRVSQTALDGEPRVRVTIGHKKAKALS